MTKKTPPPAKLMGAYGHATPPLLKAIFFRLQIWLDQKDPRQNFMDAFHHVTPVLNDILDLCKFDLMLLTPSPAKILRMHFVRLHLC